MIRHPIALFALGLSLLLPIEGRAQPAAASVDPAAVYTQAAPQPAVPLAGQGTGLPQQAPAPRTLKEYWHVFVLISLAWIGIVGYLLRCGPSMGRIAQRVGMIEPDHRSS